MKGERIDVLKLSLFLDALDEWGCTDNDERAESIRTFIESGCNLSEYKSRPNLRLVDPEAPNAE